MIFENRKRRKLLNLSNSLRNNTENDILESLRFLQRGETIHFVKKMIEYYNGRVELVHFDISAKMIDKIKFDVNKLITIY